MELQPVSEYIWDMKHRLKNEFMEPVDLTLDDTFRRVAKTLAAQEEPERRQDWERSFYEIIKNGCYPGGRILSNAGASQYKPNTTLINCVVASNIHDSLEDILKVALENGNTLKTGAGIGFCFSTIRPKGAFVRGVGAQTSGPLSFADIYDKICFAIASAGGRRGSMMLTFHVFHPDVYEVIKAKREDGRLRQFNISLLITDSFVDAVKNNLPWNLYFPIHKDDPHIVEENQQLYADWPIKDDSNYLYRDDGKVLCKIYRTINAKHLWDTIMEATYNYAEPGFILIDRVNRENNLFFCEDIIATNPCGEQPLPSNNSCLLGSVNLVKYVTNPFSPEAKFDFNQFKLDIYIFNRMLDNVIEISNLPLENQRNELLRKRRHGIGFLGLGSLFNMMMLRYGDKASINLTSKISEALAITSIEAGIDLAMEKGPAPIMLESFTVTQEMINKSPTLGIDYKIGEVLLGKELIVYSGYLQRMPEKLRNAISMYGMRFSHATSIAPTGTMAFGIGNNVSNGIENTLYHEAIRNVIKLGKKTKEAVTTYSYEALLYKQMFGKDSKLPEYFGNSDTIMPTDHIAIQAAAQPWIDSAISKCIAKGTRVVTDKGLIKIESFTNNREHGLFEELEFEINALCSDNNYHKIISHYCDGIRPTKKITFDNGVTKEVSLTHKFIDESTLRWKSASNFKVGDKVLYKAATPLHFNAYHHEHYGFIHGILKNSKIVISNTEIRSTIDPSIIDLNRFCSIINSLKDLKLVYVNNVIELDVPAFNYISKLKHEFSYNKIFKLSLLERENYIKALNINPNKSLNNLFFAHFEIVPECQLVSEVLYSIGKDAVIKDGNVIELSKTRITNDIIPTAIVKIEDGENELFDISVQTKHEYLIHGIISHNTINCPQDINFDTFKQIYIDGYDNGLKGLTTFRFNPEAFQGVIVKQDDLKNTKYCITLEDNSELTLSGDEIIHYNKDETTVANLYDALKEGYYGKF